MSGTGRRISLRYAVGSTRVHVVDAPLKDAAAADHLKFESHRTNHCLICAEGRELAAGVITAGLCELFLSGERDPQKLAQAVLSGDMPLFH